jgi:hypothetical protein
MDPKELDSFISHATKFVQKVREKDPKLLECFIPL